MADLKVSLENLQAIIPFYVQGTGDVTKIIDKNGVESNCNVRVKTVLNKLAKIYMTDICAMREKYGNMINQKYMIPLPFCPELTLIPFKMRNPKIPADGSLGYISLSAIKKVERADNNKNVEITTYTNNLIKCMVTYNTSQRNINNAILIKNDRNMLYKQTSNNPFSGQTIYGQLYYDDCEKPATRADLIFLAAHISKLINGAAPENISTL